MSPMAAWFEAPVNTPSAWLASGPDSPALRPVQAFTPSTSGWLCDLAWLLHGHPFILRSVFWPSELSRVQFPSFPAFPSVAHSSAPLATLERRVPDLSEAIYEVARPAKACTTGSTASSLPELNVPCCTQKHSPAALGIISGGQRGEVEAYCISNAFPTAPEPVQSTQPDSTTTTLDTLAEAIETLKSGLETILDVQRSAGEHAPEPEEQRFQGASKATAFASDLRGTISASLLGRLSETVETRAARYDNGDTLGDASDVPSPRLTLCDLRAASDQQRATETPSNLRKGPVRFSDTLAVPKTGARPFPGQSGPEHDEAAARAQSRMRESNFTAMAASNHGEAPLMVSQRGHTAHERAGALPVKHSQDPAPSVETRAAVAPSEIAREVTSSASIVTPSICDTVRVPSATSSDHILTSPHASSRNICDTDRVPCSTRKPAHVVPSISILSVPRTVPPSVRA
ncbi:hypothetical protein EDB89DRAFT_2069025 [Lactarius sanguifluus]|nr:hypothetical protein EDB89DRAFT_2069025 [Lactarius sanguifluus]